MAPKKSRWNCRSGSTPVAFCVGFRMFSSCLGVCSSRFPLWNRMPWGILARLNDTHANVCTHLALQWTGVPSRVFIFFCLMLSIPRTGFGHVLKRETLAHKDSCQVWKLTPHSLLLSVQKSVSCKVLRWSETTVSHEMETARWVNIYTSLMNYSPAHPVPYIPIMISCHASVLPHMPTKHELARRTPPAHPSQKKRSATVCSNAPSFRWAHVMANCRLSEGDGWKETEPLKNNSF